MYSAIEHFVNMALYKCCILLLLLLVERGSSPVECRSRNQVSFLKIGYFHSLHYAPVHSAV